MMVAASRIKDLWWPVVVPALGTTLLMVVVTAVLAILLGTVWGMVLYVSEPHGLHPHRLLHALLSRLADIIRSFPTLILLVSIAPVTRWVIGTTIGPPAAIFAMTVGCAPFVARMTENALRGVEPELVTAAQSFGASYRQIVTRVLWVEAIPAFIDQLSLMLINMLNMSAIAGAVGAGGLGAVALTYGYQQFDYGVMYTVVAMLMVLVFAIQGLGRFLRRQFQ